MGLFSGFGLNKNQNTVNLTKEESFEKINLRKEEIKRVCLKKSNSNSLTARVALVLDYSGSMRTLYENGTVQSVVEKMLPIAMTFDDNGEMEVWIFENNFVRLPNVSLDNYYGYVNNEIVGKYEMGGTKYAPVMMDIYSRYIMEEPAKIPNYVIFITDGDNADHGNTSSAVKVLSEYPIFFQFVGIGQEKFYYLETLDDMQNRYVDNANFFKVEDVNNITYEQLLNEYPEWIANPKVKDMLK